MISENLGAGQPYRQPFPYYVAQQALTDSASQAMLEWLETDAPWNLVEESFYEQYELNFHHVDLPLPLRNMVGLPALQAVRQVVETMFDVKLRGEVCFVAHKLAAGQRIRVHNDYVPGQHTHRLLIQLNRGWADENGGLLVFFNSNSAKDVHKIFRPQHNSCVAFAIQQNSFHAVTPINSGDRYTLVYSFFEQTS